MPSVGPSIIRTVRTSNTTAIVTWAPLGNEIARGNIAELDSSSGYCVAVAATTSAGTGPYGSPATIQGIVVNATIQ